MTESQTCSDCGSEHRVLESLPARPLTASDVEDLRASDSLTFVAGARWLFGDVAPEFDEEVTEDVVLATDQRALLLSLYGIGWVVEREVEPGPDETAAEAAHDLLMAASSALEAEMERLLA